MGRKYAGILGPLAFATVVARGLLGRHGVEATILWASCCLFAFAAAGYVFGKLAGWIVAEAMQARFNAELAALEAAEAATGTRAGK
jgi:hypothetical protein